MAHGATVGLNRLERNEPRRATAGSHGERSSHLGSSHEKNSRRNEEQFHRGYQLGVLAVSGDLLGRARRSLAKGHACSWFASFYCGRFQAPSASLPTAKVERRLLPYRLGPAAGSRNFRRLRLPIALNM